MSNKTDNSSNSIEEKKELARKLARAELELRKVQLSTTWRLSKPLRIAGIILRKVLPRPMKRLSRKSYDRLRNKVFNTKRAFDKDRIQYNQQMRLAKKAVLKKDWRTASDLWKKTLDDYGKVQPLELMHLHKERSSIAMLDILKELDQYKKNIKTYRAKRQKRYSKPKIAVYTAITGNYDTLKIPGRLDERFDYFVFTDGPIEDVGIYTIKPIPYLDLDNTRSARYIKTHPHTLLKDYDIAIWVDANIMINGDIYPIIESFMKSNKAVAALPHPLREYVFEEVKACIALNKDDEEVIMTQLQKYEAAGFNDKGLIESNVMMFDLRNERLNDFLTTWWSEINQFSRRDQISLMYALRENKIRWHGLMKRPMNARNHPLFVLIPHNTNEELQRIVVDSLKTGIVNPYELSAKRLKKDSPKFKSVDIVVCVHNARDDVEICLKSIVAHRSSNHKLIIIDDGSESPTADFLTDFSKGKSWVKLHRNETAGGYTKAANAGLKLSTAEFVVLLNSDTIVTKSWIEKMSEAVLSVPRGGIVGPLSSAASHQSIPDHISSKTQTAVNGLPKDVSIDKMNQYCEQWFDSSIYPVVPLVHGFCFGISRQVIDTIGLLDEESFPRGYGEESDYCFRAADAGFDLVVAPNTYIFHSKSKSYDDAKRIELMHQGSEKLRELYGRDRIERSIRTMQANPLLIHMRTQANKLY